MTTLCCCVQQVYLRLKTPLLTLMASALPEVSFCVLSHIEPLVKRCPGVFDDEFKQFYCRCVLHVGVLLLFAFLLFDAVLAKCASRAPSRPVTSPSHTAPCCFDPPPQPQGSMSPRV